MCRRPCFCVIVEIAWHNKWFLLIFNAKFLTKCSQHFCGGTAATDVFTSQNALSAYMCKHTAQYTVRVPDLQQFQLKIKCRPSLSRDFVHFDHPSSSIDQGHWEAIRPIKRSSSLQSSGAPPWVFDWGGGFRCIKPTYPPKKSNFYSDFGHFISKILENLKNGVYSENFRQSSWFLGDVPKNFVPGDASPRPPSGGAHGTHLCTSVAICPARSRYTHWPFKAKFNIWRSSVFSVQTKFFWAMILAPKFF